MIVMFLVSYVASHDILILTRRIGSGSMAQVYHAHLCDTSTQTYRDVAVKIAHPSIDTRINMDLFLMSAITHAITTCYPPAAWWSLTDSLTQFAHTLHQHIDLRVEARHLIRFNVNFAHISNIRFPRVITPYVHRHALMETYESGVLLDAFLTSEAATTTMAARPTVTDTSTSRAVTSTDTSTSTSTDTTTHDMTETHIAPHIIASTAVRKQLTRLGMSMFLKMMIGE